MKDYILVNFIYPQNIKSYMTSISYETLDLSYKISDEFLTYIMRKAAENNNTIARLHDSKIINSLKGYPVNVWSILLLIWR